MDSGASPGLSERWAGIGAEGALGLLAVQLWLVELPFRGAVVTAKGAHRRRPLVLVQVIASHGRTAVEGWGECAALADSTYDGEDVARSFGLLEHALVPGLVDMAPRTGMRLPRPSELSGIRRAAPDAPLAFAALEMAVADAHLRAEGRSFAERMGVPDRAVPVGAVVGRRASTGELVAEVAALVDLGFSRVKMKIAPGWDIEPVDAVRSAYPDLALQVDANGCYRQSDAGHLARLDRYGLLCLEQPLDPGDLPGHARLAARLDTPISLDESLDSPRSARAALALGACSVVCVKPGRLGGLGAALEVIEACAGDGVPLWVGGMFESGYARGVNTVLGALPGFAWPGDLSPAPTYLDADLVPPPALDRNGPGGSLRTTTPDGIGMGPSPDLGVLERFLTRRSWIEVPRG